MSGFLGRFEYQLDDKGRVSLPAAFRREAEDDAFVLMKADSPALTLLPASTWADVKRRLIEYRKSSAEARSVVRRLSANAVDVKPDKQGRILIPGWLKDEAGLDGTVLLIGALDRIEIWNPERFQASLRVGDEEFERFAPQIFG